MEFLLQEKLSKPAPGGEQISTAGVTEQALDQLILRLRKKIEEDPNSPKHIQTVKGRGLTFHQ